MKKRFYITCTFGDMELRVLFYIMIIAALSGIDCNPGKSSRTASSSPVTVTGDFDSGSIDTLWESKPNFLTGWPIHWKQKSSSDNQYYWFYFKLNNVAGKDITIKLDSLAGIYRGGPHLIYTKGTQPVYSYDQKNWQRISNVRYDDKLHSLTFRNTFAADSVWVAYAHPFSYSQGLALIDSIAGKPFLTIETLGTTQQGRNIHLLTVTDTAISDVEKKTVFITTLQHPGEYCGGYVVSGLLNFLLSDDENAAIARKTTVYKIIPMMNPDGIFHGITRFNGNYEDLNQEWDDDFTDTLHLPVEPEVACVKEWIRGWLNSGRHIDLGLDIHSQGQQGSMNLLHTPESMLADLTPHFNNYWPVEYIPMEFPGSLNNCLAKEFHIPSGTFEIPQSGIKNEAYLTIDDYYNYGKGIALGITDYFLKSK
ncbi:M14-type cytosolic carboxypeptidase [Agriterribacter sp.]|uniref:M14-type cytosolic carboxypeptidase n=1 Tax=Agriterribacter sp. TaxID=2821509 RepID=UPI002CA2D512|nr:M14-type cytosolic carboxypeptidase [Agriterribacter sp.]HRO47065.1 M14-type cytosolic carboxypeptidase [Agriterribacter sp.]HRQ19032.1 M14-type cytosolic carboxypeptidase [Agriterribacter sp.]